MNVRKKFLMIGFCAFVFFALFFSVIFAILNMNHAKVLHGVSIGPINISGLTLEEAKAKVADFLETNVKSNIDISYKDFNDVMNPAEFNISVEETLIESAFLLGKNGNIVQNNYTILFTLLFGKNIPLEFHFDSTLVDKKISEVSNKIPESVIQNSYYIEDTHLIIKKGSSGIAIKEEEFYNLLVNTFASYDRSLTIPIKHVNPENIDLQKIHDEIYKEPKDASVTKDPVSVIPQVNGIDFAISIEEAQKLLEEEKEEYSIPLKITIPSKTLDNLGEDAFPSLLGTYTTRFDPSNKNRSINLGLSSDKIDGTVILPGETFSYNKVVGERTISAGYKEAAVYSGGKVVNGIGGGICQLSSTLYNAALYANLEIVSRTNHRFLTSYVPAGQDATVSWGTIDFQFKNNRSYPIKLVSTAKNGVVKVEFYGIKEKEEYQVIVESTVTDTIPYTTNYMDDPELEEGKTKVEQIGANGAKSVTYKILKFNGAIVSKTVLSNDSYSALENVIRRGTKKVSTVSAESSSDNSTP